MPMFGEGMCGFRWRRELAERVRRGLRGARRIASRAAIGFARDVVLSRMSSTRKVQPSSPCSLSIDVVGS